MNKILLKKAAAEEAVKEIKDGMIIGLGSGSTVQYALEEISSKIKSGELKNIHGVPSSDHTEEISRKLGIPIISLSAAVDAMSEGKKYPIDITIDGADEVDQNLNLIKGGGAALLREKIVAQASARLIIIIDETKISKFLGEKWAVPVEVIKFAFNSEKKFLESIGAKTSMRKNSSGENYITDENNFIIDAAFGEIKDVYKLDQLLNQRAGIVEHGIFADLTDTVVCAGEEGIRKLKRV